MALQLRMPRNVIFQKAKTSLGNLLIGRSRCCSTQPKTIEQTLKHQSDQWDKRMKAIFQNRLGFDKTFQFRTKQREAIVASMLGYSVFLILPTGVGKSICYQLPAMLKPGIQIIVSPLLSLIQDQVSKLQALGENVIQIDSTQSKEMQSKSLEKLLTQSDIQFVYCTPESIVHKEEFHETLEKLLEMKKLARVVVDEVHCVVEWGSTFRPAYLELGKLWKERFSGIPVTLATATATKSMQEEILGIFGLQSIEMTSMEVQPSLRYTCALVLANFSDRINLHLQVRPKTKLTSHDIVKTLGDHPSIVYTLTQKEAVSIAKDLQLYGCNARYYHGDMSPSERNRIQQMWQSNKVKVICATIAFGMGIDRKDVRFVIHHSIPLSISSYYQQIGRAGRDGKDAMCILYYSMKDKVRALEISTSSSSGHSRRMAEDIDDMVSFCETNQCRRKVIFNCLDLPFEASECCKNCNCGQLDLQLVNSQDDVDFQVANEKSEKSSSSITRHFKIQPNQQQQDFNVESLYRRIVEIATKDANSKKQKFSKRDILSRKVLKDILQRKPSTIEDLINTKGVGRNRALLFYDIIQKYYCNKNDDQ